MENYLGEADELEEKIFYLTLNDVQPLLMGLVKSFNEKDDENLKCSCCTEIVVDPVECLKCNYLICE